MQSAPTKSDGSRDRRAARKLQREWPDRIAISCFVVGCAGWIAVALDFTLVLLLFADLREYLHATRSELSWALTVTLLFRLLGGFVGGVAIERYGARGPFIVSALSVAATSGLGALSPNLTTFLISRALFGSAMGAQWASSAALCVRNWPKGSQSIASGVLHGSWAIGYLIASVFVSLSFAGHRHVSIMLVACCVSAVVACAAVLVQERHSEGVQPEVIGIIGVETRTPIIITPLFFVCYYSLTALYPELLRTEFHRSIEDTGRAIAMFNIGFLVGAAAIGWALLRYPIRGVVIMPALASLAVIPVYVELYPFSTTWGAFAMGALGAGPSGVLPMFLFRSYVAKHQVSRAAVVYHFGAVAASFVPPLIAGLAKQGLGLQFSIALVASVAQGALAVAAAVVLRARSTLPQ
jgi:SHS family lactate transporter-like MFS transporter